MLHFPECVHAYYAVGVFGPVNEVLLTFDCDHSIESYFMRCTFLWFCMFLIFSKIKKLNLPATFPLTTSPGRPACLPLGKGTRPEPVRRGQCPKCTWAVYKT